MTWIDGLAFIILIWALIFHRMPTKIWLPTVTVALLAVTFLGHLPLPLLIVSWLVFLLIVAATQITMVRQAWLIRPMLRRLQKILPPISAAEREVVEAGDVWWEKELFCGRPDWRKLAAIPCPTMTGEEQLFLDQQVETLCTLIDDWQCLNGQTNDLPPQVWDYLKKEGFFGISIDKAYGGKGFSSLAQSNIVTKIATRSVSAAITVMVPNALGPAEFLQHHGTQAQKEYYLPRLATGVEIPAFALTAPEAGSDASNISDSGVICLQEYEGKSVLGIRLNWSKRYITLAPVATLLGLVVKLYDPERLLGEQVKLGITLCLVPTALPGVDTGQRHNSAGLAFLNGPTRGQQVFVPLDHIIGGPAMAGKGWRMMMEGLAGGRGISLPALSSAIAKLCYRMTGAYAVLRHQFSQSIGEFEGVAERLARIGGLTYVCEAGRLFTLSGINHGVKPALAAAISKYHLTEMARVIINDALDIHAGRGVQLGPSNYLWPLYQAIPLCITVEGANILTRNLILFGQGAMRCHPYIHAEMLALADPNPQQSLQQFDGLLQKHIGFALSNAARVLFHGLTGGLLVRNTIVPRKSPHHYYFRQLTRMSAALALTADMVMMLLGGQLKRSENISARLGDVLSQLYLASAILKYDQDYHHPATDLPFLHWGLQQSLHAVEQAFLTLFANLKPNWLARLLRTMIFPWGQAYSRPRDELSQAVATTMMQPDSERDRFTAHCFIKQSEEDLCGRMELAFKAWRETALQLKKLSNAISRGDIQADLSLSQQLAQAEQIGILTSDELHYLQRSFTLRWNALQVDEFEEHRHDER